MVKKVFGITGEIPDLPARYNIAPSQQILVIRQDSGGGRNAAFLRWGLVPSWAKDPAIGAKLINARAETVHEKPSFRHALRSRRCLVPASGFYEWGHEGKLKIPYYVRMADSAPLPLAGLWESWKSPDGEKVETCTILTTEANALMAGIHDRMPVIIHPSEFDLWLGKEVDDVERLGPLFTPYPSDRLVAYRVSSEVNTPVQDHPGLIVPVGNDASRGEI